nr:immunoglobulin heavy chain junction region [Macaca mulatta]MOX61715.1 immunoglobulin heavy chain junction region [Macaca mulatta]MOX64025.1 immunoglobulin heavy chain junction region [Macaca mulatta]MOX64336.1 immunoglobulin heavy chain junction region [Macaca mulatta]
CTRSPITAAGVFDFW